MPYERDPAEFATQLATELRHLRRSCEAYDAGDRTEAQRLSVTVRKLVHDTRSATSLLTHLGIKDQVRYFDTRLRPSFGRLPGTIRLHSGIVMTRLNDGGAEYEPFLATDDPERGTWCDFETWWRATVVADLDGNDFARCDLVLGLADQDGGAHFDRTLSPKYAALTRANSLGQHGSGPDGKMRPLGPGIATATMRQVSFEIEHSLHEHLVTARPGASDVTAR